MTRTHSLPLAATRRSFRPVLAICSLFVLAPSLTAQQPVAARLTLGTAARMAAERSVGAVISRERAYQSGARAVQYRSDLLPTLTSGSSIDGGDDVFPFATSGGTGSPSSFPTQRTVNFRLDVSQRLFDLGAIRRWQASAAGAAADAASARHDADQAAEAGALGHLRVLRDQARLEARMADSSLAAELLGIARQQLAAGTAIALDVTRAESRLASTVSDLITARNERARSELELRRLLSLPVHAPIQLGDSLRAPLPVDAAIDEEGAVRDAQARRGDVLAAQTAADAARRQVSAVRAERLPAVSLYGVATGTTDRFMNQQMYGIKVTTPLFDGFRREARIAEGRSREREAEAERKDATLRAEVEVRSAVLDLGAARERVAAATAQLDLAELELAQARARFQAGVASNADVIDASLSLNRARDQVVDARTAFHAARIGFASARGRTVELQ